MSIELGFKPTTAKPYYFISFHSQDAERVSEICRELHLRDVPMWYDKGLLTGNKQEAQIIKRIENCHEMIFFITKNLMTSDDGNVYRENL